MTGRGGRLEDVTTAQLAGRLRTGQDSGVVVSGRCGTCGYLLTTIGHKISCANGDTPAPRRGCGSGRWPAMMDATPLGGLS